MDALKAKCIRDFFQIRNLVLLVPPNGYTLILNHLLYHRYQYLISFLDDFTFNAWVILLRCKNDALNTTKDFAAPVETQHKTNKIQEWMSDAGGEYKLQEFDKSKGKDSGFTLYCMPTSILVGVFYTPCHPFV